MTAARKHKLRSGFTTGAAAAAATKGALYLLLDGRARRKVRIGFIDGGHQDIQIYQTKQEGAEAVCSVIKDAGDDPDVTNHAEIGVRVTLKGKASSGLLITGGEGVGVVTKPGLETPPGEPAITSGPRTMIQTSVAEVFDELKVSPAAVQVEVFVPKGEELAKKTLNARLGIIGGISILGTTGVVRPMSHEADIATIQSSLSVAEAGLVKQVFFTTGRRSERFAQKLWPAESEEAFIQIGDFFRMSVESASRMTFQTIVLVVFFGKALKMAYGYPHTHAGKADMSMKKLSDWTMELTGNSVLSEQVAQANTARQAFFMLQEEYPHVISRVGEEMVRSAEKFVSGKTGVCSVILDFEGRVVFHSSGSPVAEEREKS